jgi:putative acetyltransferase
VTITENLIVRREEPEDQTSVRLINESAFERRDEADLVDSLRREDAVLLSLVADARNHLVGHILFSRMWIDHAAGSIAAVALAPIAVLLSHQRIGIGAKLIESGLDHLRRKGERIVIVLGHPSYYARFGFSTETTRGLEAPFPRNAFMAVELGTGAIGRICGKVRYPAAFGL